MTFTTSRLVPALLVLLLERAAMKSDDLRHLVIDPADQVQGVRDPVERRRAAKRSVSAMPASVVR